MRMPDPNPAVLAERERIVADLARLVHAPEGVIGAPSELAAYETDGFTAYKQLPLAVVLPETTEEVAAVLAYCHQHKVKVVARGAGTSLTGGALPLADGIVLGVGKMNQVLEVDLDNRAAVVQAGVTNMSITNTVAPEGFFYAPDPSSQIACTIAGNVAMNSGGAHCLKYGVTTNNLLGAKVVLIDGTVVEIGGKHLDAAGYDLLGLLTGAEGTLGVVTEVTVRILAAPEGAKPVLFGFETTEAAGACVADIIASGIIPVAIEFMDRPAIHAAEAFAKAGYPLDVEALLIIEVEGSDEEMDDLLARIVALAEPHAPKTVRRAETEAEALAIWKGRKSAFGAVGQISPDYFCMDGTIPTGRLPEVLGRIKDLADAAGFQVANVFHAGDGNLHPLILYDANAPGELRRAEALGMEVLKLCVEVGGCLTGEHGVGIEKRDLMTAQFSDIDLDQQRRLRAAFDPDTLLNAGKVLPLEAEGALDAAE